MIPDMSCNHSREVKIRYFMFALVFQQDVSISSEIRCIRIFEAVLKLWMGRRLDSSLLCYVLTVTLGVRYNVIVSVNNCLLVFSYVLLCEWV